MFILIDNYDSFTWNLWHFLSDLGAAVEIVRNDAATPDEVLARAPQGLVLSPGPGTPQDAGITIELIHAAARANPRRRPAGSLYRPKALAWPPQRWTWRWDCRRRRRACCRAGTLYR